MRTRVKHLPRIPEGRPKRNSQPKPRTLANTTLDAKANVDMWLHDLLIQNVMLEMEKIAQARRLAHHLVTARRWERVARYATSRAARKKVSDLVDIRGRIEC